MHYVYSYALNEALVGKLLRLENGLVVEMHLHCLFLFIVLSTQCSQEKQISVLEGTYLRKLRRA